MQIGVETSRAVNGKRIFIVQMDGITRTVLQFILQDENEAHDLPTVQDALDKARDWPPNLVVLGLSDVNSDPVLLARIGTALKQARILLVADPGQEAVARGLVGKGAHGVLNKPLAVESVRRQVDATLGLLAVPMVQLSEFPA